MCPFSPSLDAMPLREPGCLRCWSFLPSWRLALSFPKRSKQVPTQFWNNPFLVHGVCRTSLLPLLSRLEVLDSFWQAYPAGWGEIFCLGYLHLTLFGSLKDL